MTFRPGEMGARFQLIRANLAVQLAVRRQAGLGGVEASFYHPGTQGQGWELAFQGLDSSPGKCGAVRDCRQRPRRKSIMGGGLEERGMRILGQ